MQQLSLIDPAIHPVATQAMLDDAGLRDAIATMRGRSPSTGDWWPYVEHLCDIGGRPVWAVDDAGTRYVVVSGGGRLVFTIFQMDDLLLADEKIRTAAMDMFGRLNWNAAHLELAS